MNSLLGTSPLDLSGRHVFITGGTGFLGRSILDYLAESASVNGPNFRVTVMSRSPGRFLARFPQYSGIDWLSVVTGDLERFPAVDGITDVLHAAADTHGVTDKARWMDQIYRGTRSTLEWSLEVGATRFLFVSSGAVYGTQPPHMARIEEEYPGAPSTTALSSVYGQAKRLAEQLCTVYASEHSMGLVIARCFAVVGPHIPVPGPYAMGNFIHDALNGDEIVVNGDGSAVRTYLYARDLAHWLVTLLVRGRSGEAYNVGSDQPVSMSELASMVRESAGSEKPVKIRRDACEDLARSIYVPDITKSQVLGLRVETPLEEAVRLTLASIAQR